MDTGTTTQDDPGDRRSTKRRKPGSASSFNSNPIAKPAKQTKDDFNLNCSSKTLTCVELGYSNFPGGNGFQNSLMEKRQVTNSSHSDNIFSPLNAFDYPNTCRENEFREGKKILNVKSGKQLILDHIRVKRPQMPIRVKSHR